MRDIPVYIFNGFLDSGKTTFIKETILSDNFHEQGRTLLIVLEDGEVEYELDMLEKYGVDICYFDNQSKYSMRKINDIVRKFNSKRIFIEMNCMWDMENFELPPFCQVLQEVLFINFETFPIYFNNMRQRFVELFKQADLVIFNRCDDPLELREYQTNIKMINNQADYIAMNNEGKVCDAFEKELPFDINADVIEIKDDDYGEWYMDTFDNKDNYEGKKVSFNALVVKSDKLPLNTFVAGRLAMTCCADDIQLFGHLCNGSLDVILEDRDWIHLECIVNYEYNEEYQEEEAILTPLKIEKIEPISKPVLNFV